MPDDALIHLRVPASLKARWVRESRAAGMRLTDWILQRMEHAMQHKTTTAIIPHDVRFSDPVRDKPRRSGRGRIARTA